MIDGIVKWRWPILVALVSICLGIGVYGIGVKKAYVPDNSLTVWFLETDPKLESYRDFQENFANDEVILIQVTHKSSVFEADFLKRLRALSTQIAGLDGVERVHSIVDVQIPANVTDEEGDSMKFVQLTPAPIPTNSKALQAIRNRALSDSMLVDRLISHDGSKTMLWVQMAVMKDIDNKRDHIVGEVRKIAEEVLGETPHPMAGVGVIYSGLNQITQHDFGLFVGIGYLLMFAVLWWVFRSMKLVLAALGVIALGTLASLGVYGSLGNHINMVTIVIPTLVIVLGIADVVHFPAAYLEVLRNSPDGASNPTAMVTAMLHRVFIPCLLTTVTTMAGFLALASAPMAVIRDLGIYASIGIGVALIASVVIMSVACHAIRPNFKLPNHRWIDQILTGCRRLLENRPVVLATVTVAIVAVSVVGMLRISTDTYTIKYLPNDHPVVTDHKRIESEWGDYGVLEFLVEPREGLRADSCEVLTAMNRFVQKATELDEIRNGISLYNLYYQTADIYSQGHLKGKPLTKRMIESLQNVMFDAGDYTNYVWDRKDPKYHDNVVAPLMNKKATRARVTLVGRMMSAQNLGRLLDQITEIAEKAMIPVADDGCNDDEGEKKAEGQGQKPLATVTPAGYPPLYVSIIDYVMTSQIRSFYIAVSIIFLLMLVWMRSLRLALISIVPNLFPVLVMLGVMGWSGIELDIATATVGAIVIGVAVDDTVHFLHHWREAENDRMSWSDSLQYTFIHAGRAAVITSVLLLVSYPVLMFAGVKTVVYFGLLTTVAAAAALFGDLVVLPLILRVFPQRDRSAGGVA
jgi:predicted RND superfamily exporter protein